MPPDCDKAGPTQCATGTGGARDTSTDTSTGGGTAGTGSTGGTGSSIGGLGTATDATAVAQTDPDGTALDAQSGPIVVQALPQSLPTVESGVLPRAAMTAVGTGMLGATLLPPLLGKRRRKNLLPTPTRGSPRRSR
jgi:hypothetical protein